MELLSRPNERATNYYVTCGGGDFSEKFPALPGYAQKYTRIIKKTL